ncbi:MAG: rod shape-determining protein MreC [Desulfomicrobium escambiense]|nr:rod shape-determining protein MreC [Desulfomicrobium escambiense]
MAVISAAGVLGRVALPVGDTATVQLIIDRARRGGRAASIARGPKASPSATATARCASSICRRRRTSWWATGSSPPASTASIRPACEVGRGRARRAGGHGLPRCDRPAVRRLLAPRDRAGPGGAGPGVGAASHGAGRKGGPMTALRMAALVLGGRADPERRSPGPAAAAWAISCSWRSWRPGCSTAGWPGLLTGTAGGHAAGRPRRAASLGLSGLGKCLAGYLAGVVGTQFIVTQWLSRGLLFLGRQRAQLGVLHRPLGAARLPPLRQPAAGGGDAGGVQRRGRRAAVLRDRIPACGPRAVAHAARAAAETAVPLMADPLVTDRRADRRAADRVLGGRARGVRRARRGVLALPGRRERGLRPHGGEQPPAPALAPGAARRHVRPRRDAAGREPRRVRRSRSSASTAPTSTGRSARLSAATGVDEAQIRETVRRHRGEPSYRPVVRRRRRDARAGVGRARPAPRSRAAGRGRRAGADAALPVGRPGRARARLRRRGRRGADGGGRPAQRLGGGAVRRREGLQQAC